MICNKLVSFSLSVSSALLPHVETEKESSPRWGHSGEGWLDEHHLLPLPPHHTSSPPSSQHQSEHAFFITRDEKSCSDDRRKRHKPQESAFSYRIHLARNVSLEWSCLQTQCSWSSAQPRSWIYPAALAHAVAAVNCTGVEGGPEAGREKRKETWKEDDKVELTPSPSYMIGPFISLF